jgi:glycine/D-amino acid oxidase-like deaminating enzyme
VRRLYPASAYLPVPDPGNFWQATAVAEPPPPLEGDATADVAIIGAGYTGLNAALRLADHGIGAVVLDAAWPGWGASGRNGGFACLGGTRLSGPQVVERCGADGARAFFAAQVAAVEHVADTLARLGIEADRAGSGEYLIAHRRRAYALLADRAAFFEAWYGRRAAVLRPRALAQRGMHGPRHHGALHLPVGFGLNPLKYALGLAAAAAARGVRLHGSSEVTVIARTRGRFRLLTARGALLASRLIVATNGYSADGLPGWITGRYLPVVSNILVTRPLTGAELAAQSWTVPEIAADTRRLLRYFRLLPDGRFLFGMRGGTGLAEDDVARMRLRIRAAFAADFPAWAHVDTPWFWNGLACVTRDLAAYAGPVPGLDGAYAAFGYHGGGVAMGSWAGARIADLLAGTLRLSDLPQLLTRPPPRYPLPRLRRHFLKPAYAWHDWRDSWRGLPYLRHWGS